MPVTKKSSSQRAAAGKKQQKSVGAELSPTHTPARGGKSPKKSTAKKSSPTALADAIHEGLLNVGSAVVGGFADEVIQLYRDGSDMAALATLVGVICRGAGVPVVAFDPDAMQDQSAVTPALEEALARVPTMSTYLLLAKDQRKYRRALPAFFERVTELAAAERFLNDGVFVETLWPWLAAMVESKARNFRHTATVATFAMVKVVSELCGRADLAVSSAKNRKDRTDAQARQEALVQLHRDLFNATFHARCKDTSPEIRLLAFKTLRDLMLTNPALHLSNQYLRYLSVALHDKKTDIRLEGLDTIVAILGEQPDHAHRLREFLAHFATRLVEMAADTDTKVADLALKIAALIVNMDKNAATDEDAVLSDEMVDQLLMAIADDRRVMRSTAGTLLRMFIRCRVDSSAGPKVRAETLCSFVTTLRTAFDEPLAERYVIDALWTDPPPMLIAEYKHFSAIATAKDAEPSMVATALGLLAALAERCAGSPLELGPGAKDDLKVQQPAARKETVDPATLRGKLTKDLVPLVTTLLEAHGSEPTVQRAAGMAVAALEMEQVAASRVTAQYTELLLELRRVTLLATDEAALDALGAAWSHVVTVESTVHTESEAQLQQLARATMKAVKDAEGKTARRGSKASQSQSALEVSDAIVASWRRAAVLSSILSLVDYRGVLSTSLTRFAASVSAGTLASDPAACSALTALVSATHRTVLWQIAAQQEGGASTDDVAESVGDIVPKLVTIAALDAEGHPEALSARAAAACAACDLLALPFVTLDSTEQEEAIAAFGDCALQLADSAAAQSDALRDTVRLSVAAHDLSDGSSRVTQARRRVNAIEASLVRVVTAVARLFTFERVASTGQLAAEWMQLWTRVAGVKSAADVFKTLFHVLRDRLAASDSSALERDMLVTAAKQCAAAGANPAALEQLHQVGVKLSSMHFVPTDKYYPVAVAIVKGAVEHAETSNDLILHGVAPYCSRLRVPDALAIANNLQTRDMFTTSNAADQTPIVRAFVSAARRAAKLEAAGVPGETPGRTPGAATVASSLAVSRTGRTTARKRVSRGIEVAVDEDDILANIVRESRAIREVKKSQGGSQRQPPQPSAESLGAGWRGRGAEQPSQSPSRGARGANSAQASQQPQLTMSSMIGDDEVFVATQEWA